MSLPKLRMLLLAFSLLLPFFAPGEKRPEGPEPKLAATALPPPTSAPNVVSMPIARPSGVIVKVSDIKTVKELGRRINLADRMIGGRDGSIIVDLAGDIEAPLHIKPHHRLYFSEGTFSLSVPNRDTAAILLEDQTAVYGAGIDKTILLEPENGYHCISSAGLFEPANGIDWSGVRSDITVAGLTVKGRNVVPEGGARSTIGLGNAHTAHVYNVKLKDTSALGVTVGGGSGEHAQDVLVEESISEGVASQTWNVVNGRDITFKHIIALNTGKLCDGKPCEGATTFDVEPNTSKDAASNITITDCWIDSSGSKFLHGNGILIQNGAQVPDFGPVTVTRNHVDGGPGYFIATGIYLAARNALATDNYVTRAAHSGLRLEGASGNRVERNELVSTGTGGILAFEIINSSGNTIRFNKIKVDPKSPLGNSMMIEKGTSDKNTFRGNVVGRLDVIGKLSRVEGDR